MGKYFLGSRAGDDAKYAERERMVAESLPAPKEFAEITISDPKDIQSEWLERKVFDLFKQHLKFEDELMAGTVAEAIRRGDSPQSILVTVTAISHHAKAAFKVMQELWASLPTAPRLSDLKGPRLIDPKAAPLVSDPKIQPLDEIAALRQKVVANMASRQHNHRNPNRETRVTVTGGKHRRGNDNPDIQSRHYRRYSPRPRRRHSLIDVDHRRILSDRHHDVRNRDKSPPSIQPEQTTTIEQRGPPAWESIIREKAWQVASLSYEWSKKLELGNKVL